MKKFSISTSTIFLVVLLLALAVYWFTYFVPAQSEMSLLRSETSLYNAESAVYRQYLTDSSPLEAEIEAVQKEIDELNSTGYINDSTVSFKISDAIQRYGVSLSSITLSDVTTFEGYRVLPINLTLKGQLPDVLNFIQHFENNQEGSYLVRGSTLEVAGNMVNVNLVIFLCTPNM